MLDPHALMSGIREAMPFAPTDQQAAVIGALSRFVTTPTSTPSAFVLNGYAGTGKTTLVGALVKALDAMGITTVLMAPTGRAAKVFSSMAGREASTIHRRIYRVAPADGGDYRPLSLGRNKDRYAVFIIDEASMIGGDDTPERSSLLEDVIGYVFSDWSNKLILLGDPAQLPPVGLDDSPALSVERLRALGLKAGRAVLTRTVRQAAHSGILYNATWQRQALTAIASGLPVPPLKLFAKAFPDVTTVAGYDLVDEVATAYSRYGQDNVLLITRANWSATQANLTIRTGVLGAEEQLVRGEKLMVAKNNYSVLKPGEGVANGDFIANGDMITIERIIATEIRHGFEFADVEIGFPDRERPQVICKILLNTLTSNAPALDHEASARLWQSRIDEYLSLDPTMTKAAMRRALAADPWLNALQVKYAYAVTCHKAQGGQWPCVMVDLSGFAIAESPREQYRWLYTATTRATQRLVLINPPEEALK